MSVRFIFGTIGVLIVLINQVQAATKVKARERLRDNRDSPSRFNRKRSIGDAQTDGSQHFRDVFDLYGDEAFEITAFASTAQGGAQVRLKETFKGQDVMGTTVTLTTNPDGEEIQDASGEFVQNIEKDIREPDVSLTEGELFQILINVSGDFSYVEHISNQKITYNIYTDDDLIAHPIANLEYLIETDDVQKRPMAVISTKTGEIFFHYDSLETCFSSEDDHLYGGNTKIGKRFFNNSERCLEMEKVGDSCYLVNEYVKIIDMKRSAFETSSEPASFECNGTYSDSINGAYSPALDALYYGTQIVKMFREWYNIEPVENGLVLRVHFSKNAINAYWNGYNVTFGDGRSKVVFPLVGLDVAAHEIAHGFTEQRSGLIYLGQSGGLNEAFSDIAGEMAEFYTTNTTDWLVGADIMYRRPMRYFDDPTRDGRSIAHMSQFSNRLSPHTTSGIYNKVFYLLVQEFGLNPREVFRVFIHANKMYWHPMSDFVSAACNVMQAAYDMAQPGEPFIRAFTEVGIEACDVQDHIARLRFGKKTGGISVSSISKPVFVLDAPVWSDTVDVRAHTDNSAVIIDLFSGNWAQINDSSQPLVTGSNFITFDVSDFGLNSYLVRLSTAELSISSVQITSNYTCQSDYSTENLITKKFYETNCNR